LGRSCCRSKVLIVNWFLVGFMVRVGSGSGN
jgi:hypothetical protein